MVSNSRVPEQNTFNQMPIQTIQNITNYHIDMPQQIILNGEDGRSLDRIIDQSQQDGIKRPAYILDQFAIA